MPAAIPSERRHWPVFVMGCHRSGTNLLYDMLLSAGGFAIYRGILPIYKILVPRYGSMRSRSNREHILATWLRSKGFRRTGLQAEQISPRILNECRTAGDFTRVVMDAIAEQQNLPRWAGYDADHVLRVAQIKKEIPSALFVHIIRDGRDIALSLKKMGGFTPLRWDRSETNSLIATALYWEWMVRRGQAAGRRFPADYMEVRYEDLITNPHETLGKVGSFIVHDLDYDRIQRASLGSLSETNSSFREEAGNNKKINPAGRWKERLSKANIAALEGAVGACLEENGYELSLPPDERRVSMRSAGMRLVYPAFLSSKLWLKVNTPIGRLANISSLELDEEPVQLAESVHS